MSDSRDVPKAIPVVDVLATDTPCTSCGYNLRGLRHDQACPECGAEVWRSCQGDLLRFADPEWLKRLRLGVWLLLASLAFSVVSRLMIEALYLFSRLRCGPALSRSKC